jgi:isopenicillin N synthase-like dioxygenase
MDPITYEGYSAPGTEVFEKKKTPFEIRESYNFSTLKKTYPSEKLVPKFTSSIMWLAKSNLKLIKRIMQALSMAMGLEPKHLENMCQNCFSADNYTTIRSLYYPPIHGDVEPGVVRLGEHKGQSSIMCIMLAKQDSRINRCRLWSLDTFVSRSIGWT